MQVFCMFLFCFFNNCLGNMGILNLCITSGPQGDWRILEDQTVQWLSGGTFGHT